MKFKKLKCWKDIESDGLAFKNIIKKLLKVMFPNKIFLLVIWQLVFIILKIILLPP